MWTWTRSLSWPCIQAQNNQPIQNPMKNKLLVLILLLSFNFVEAQFIKEKSMNVQLGYGLTFADYGLVDIYDDGVFAQGELVLKVASWIELRPYGGLILTFSRGNDIPDDTVTSKALLLGGKTRIRAPIPWIAPYIEVGLGASIGKFETITPFDNIEKSGIIHHIPFSLGLELGRKNNFDLGFTYFIQPTMEQYAGAVAIGFTFPLN